MYQTSGARAAHNFAFRSNFCQLYRFLHVTRIAQYCIKVVWIPSSLETIVFFFFFSFFFFCGWRRIFIRGMKLNEIRIEGRELSRVSRDFDSLIDRLVCTGLATVYWILITTLFSCDANLCGISMTLLQIYFIIFLQLRKMSRKVSWNFFFYSNRKN